MIMAKSAIDQVADRGHSTKIKDRGPRSTMPMPRPSPKVGAGKPKKTSTKMEDEDVTAKAQIKHIDTHV